MVYVKVLCFLSTSKFEETSVLLLIQCESVVAELAVLARQAAAEGTLQWGKLNVKTLRDILVTPAPEFIIDIELVTQRPTLQAQNRKLPRPHC